MVPDTQCKPGVSFKHLEGLGNYILDKRPDVLVHIGDHYDLPSLSQHSPRSHISFEGARYAEDVQAGVEGMQALLGPMHSMNRLRKANKKAPWMPEMHFTLGNHENRRQRLLDQEPYLRGALLELPLESFGWTVHPFLSPVKIGGVNFCHYAANPNGSAMGSARTIAQRKHESWCVGHLQGLDIYISPFVKTDGGRVQVVQAGSFYTHDELYKTPQDNKHWRGALLFTEVHNGAFDICTLSADYLIKNWT